MSEITKKNASAFKKLKTCTFLKDVRSGSLKAVWDLGHLKQFGKGEVILRAKEEINHIYFLLSGKVIQYNLTHLGKRKILFILGPGALLNDHVFDSHYSSIYCESIENCLVFVIPK